VFAAPLPICPFEVQKKTDSNVIDDKQRPIDGGGVHLASKTDHF
jgi:hypothetical protein